MMQIRCYKILALASAILWVGTGLITIGGIALDAVLLVINLIMGLFFILLGVFLYLRANQFHCFLLHHTADRRDSPYIQRFLCLDTVLVVGTLLAGGISLTASISRVFGEGFPVFG